MTLTAEQAARRAIEAAARVCDERAKKFDDDAFYYHELRTDSGYNGEQTARINAAVCRNDAIAIRALTPDGVMKE